MMFRIVTPVTEMRVRCRLILCPLWPRTAFQAAILIGVGRVIVEANNVIQSWLDLQCQMLGGVIRAVLLFSQQSSKQYQQRAAWPDDAASTATLSNAAALAIQRQQVVLVGQDQAPSAAQQKGDIVACPILQKNRLLGVIAIEVTSRDRASQQAVAQALQHGSIWLSAFMHHKPSTSDARLQAVFDLVAKSLEHDKFQAAAGSVLTEMASRLGYDRVSLGFVRRHHTQVEVVSRIASIDQKTNLLRAIGSAMDEALEQDATIVFPHQSDDNFQVTCAHAELAKTYGAEAICTIPIGHEGRLVGAMTVECSNESGIDVDAVALCQNITALTGPILAEKLLRDRWVGKKLWSALVRLLSKLIGPHHLLFKLATASSLLLVLFLTLTTTEYRITAIASVEGTIQRVVVAAMAGTIADASARAGDIVSEGQVLARLDDKDLLLEQRKWLSEKSQLQKEYREAMADHDSTRVSILRAQLDRASAQLGLTEEYLARTSVTSPLSGVVIQGDLSQSLGVTVERGQTLFEVARLDSYRVMLKVDERDIAAVQPGQSGWLALAGFPADFLPFIVERITPVSTAADGRNFFTVEARLEQTPDLIRPGMQGVGKIDAGPRKLWWALTHNLVDWLRVWTWSRLPWT